MDPGRWQRLEQLFFEAVELPVRERDSFVERQCADEPALRDELHSLLAAHQKEHGLLDRPPELGAPVASEAGHESLGEGTRIGVWRIGAPINRGGAGEVYFATRADGAYDQQVALKRLYRETAPDLARFHSERQILASLDHPGIARLLDGGVAADGRLYAVVEYVDGQTLTEHCAERHADLGYRLALFLQVCDVVAYAHRSLIVHRDLKPGNILVTATGRVKLLDFGVAKRIDAHASLAADATTAPYTSDYAAPEQLTGAPITTATDVYSLGVILFELLTGERPWRSDSMPIARMVQLIVHGEPPSMSRVAASGKGPVPAPRLAGDLDAIVATCLRKDVANRYPTVEALQRDIERHLGSEPVAARGRARSYVLGRALKRYRWAVGGGALLLVSIAVGLTATIWQAQRAEVERDVARRAATREEAIRYQLTNLFRTSIAKKDGTPTTAKTMLDRSAKRVLGEYRDDPQLVGKVVMTLADLYGALEDVEGQVSLLDGYLSAAGPNADRESVALAQQKLALSELLRGHAQRAAELLPKAEAVWAASPDQYREQRLESMFVRGALQRIQGDLDGSIATYKTAIAARTAGPAPLDREVANLYNSLAITLTAANRLDEALAAYRANLDIYARLGQSDDLDALVILGNTGTLAYRTGHLREAAQILKTSYEGQRERAGDSAAVAASMALYGSSLTELGRAPEAVDVLRSASEMATKFVGATSPLSIQARLFLTEALLATGTVDEASEMSLRNIAMAQERFGATSLLTLRARATGARVDLQRGRAVPAYAELAAVLEPLRKAGVPGQAWLAHALLGCGEALLAQGRPAAAVAPLREAVALRSRWMWAQSWELAIARERLGEALKASKDAEGAAMLQQAASALAAQLGDEHPQTLRARRASASPA